MAFPLRKFEPHLPNGILLKGKDYWNSNQVDNLAQDGNTWTADVYGSDEYTVEVQVVDEEVVDWTCDCPYDWGDICKHVVAVLFAIREETSKQAEFQPTVKKRGRKPKQLTAFTFDKTNPITLPKNTPPADPVLQIISQLKVEELRNLLLYLSQREPDVKAYLLTKYSNLVSTVSKNQYAALVKSILNAHSHGRHGFIEYREATRLGNQLYKLLDETKEPMGSVSLVYLCEEVIKQLTKTFEHADDSSGSMGSAMEHAFYLLNTMASDKNTPADVLKYIFEFAVKESTKKEYQGWDWAGNLRSVACAAARSRDDAGRLMETLDKSIENSKKDKFGDFEAEQAELLKMDLLRRFHSEKEAEKYLYTRLHYSRFREKALETAMQAKRYDEAKRLAKEGVELDTRNAFPGLVTKWKQWLVRISEALGDESGQASQLEELYLAWGDMEYYRQLKQLLPKADFEKKVEQFIQFLRQREGKVYWGTIFNYQVAEIFVEENRLDDLMAEISKMPSLHLLDQHSTRLLAKFKKEYIGLYEKCVRQEMDSCSSRDGYRYCAAYVDKILQLGGQEQARQIVQDWRAQYPRRPAMLDELGRFKF